jgi:hypothetical protein
MVLRGRWCNVIVLNVHAQTEEKSDDSKDSFYEELEKVFNHFPKYHTKILLGDFNAKLGREDTFKLMIGNESLHEDSNDNGVRVVIFATSKNLVVKSTMFPHRNIHKYTWTSPDGKTHNQIDDILIDRRWHSSILDVRSFGGADCDTDHSLLVAKVRERLVVIKEAAQKFDAENYKNYKKGDKRDCSNYRGISLLSTTYKILSNILLSRLTPYAKEIIGTISVDLDVTGRLLIIYCAFVKYLSKNGNAIRQYISYL